MNVVADINSYSRRRALASTAVAEFTSEVI